MYQRKLEKDIRCPLEYGMELFGGQWNLRIICVFYKDEGETPMIQCQKCDHKG